jgi:hypothetical protein
MRTAGKLGRAYLLRRVRLFAHAQFRYSYPGPSSGRTLEGPVLLYRVEPPLSFANSPTGLALGVRLFNDGGRTGIEVCPE